MVALRKTFGFISALVPARMALFLVFLAAYVYFLIDPRLVYTCQPAESTIFLPGWRAFWSSLNVPGDAADWISNWLTQYYYFGWPGVAIIVAAAWGVLRCAAAFNRAMAGAAIGGAWAVPGVLLVILHSQYEYTLGATLGVLAAMVLTVVHVRLRARGAIVRVAIFACGAAALYAVAGGASLLFTINAAIYELLAARRTAAAIIVAACGAAIAAGMGPLAPWQALTPALVIETSLHSRHLALTFAQFYLTVGGVALAVAAVAAVFDALGRRIVAIVTAAVALAVATGIAIAGPLTALRPDAWPLALNETGQRLLPYLRSSSSFTALALMALYVYIPARAMVLGFRGPITRLGQRVWRSMALESSWAASAVGVVVSAVLDLIAGGTAKLDAGEARVGRAAIVLAQSLLLAGLSMAAGWLLMDWGLRSAVKVDYYATMERWDDVLRQARTVPRSRYTYATAEAVVLALYHTGRMGQEMFEYPQGFPLIRGLFAISEMPALIRTSDVFLELGRVNEAEAVAGSEHIAPAIKRLAMARIIKGQTAPAKVCLNVLSEDVVYGAWARDCLRRLAADPLLSGDRQVTRIRSLMLDPKDDDLNMLYLRNVQQAETVFLGLLKANPQNRMAFELLMAERLVTGRLKEFCDELARLDGFRHADGRPVYANIPRHYEEAMLVYFQLTRKQTVLPGRQISSRTVKRWELFQAELKKYGTTPEGADVLGPEFGDTYFYFYYYVLPALLSGTPPPGGT